MKKERNMKLRLLHTLTLSCVLAGSALLTAQERSPSWKLTPVYTFMGLEDGSNPNEVILDAAGNLYGSAQYGGEINDCGAPYGCGVIFKVDARGHESVLYAFPPPTQVNRSAVSFATTLGLFMVPPALAAPTTTGRC